MEGSLELSLPKRLNKEKSTMCVDGEIFKLKVLQLCDGLHQSTTRSGVVVVIL